jgi:hypothetical protein
MTYFQYTLIPSQEGFICRSTVSYPTVWDVIKAMCQLRTMYKGKDVQFTYGRAVEDEEFKIRLTNLSTSHFVPEGFEYVENTGLVSDQTFTWEDFKIGAIGEYQFHLEHEYGCTAHLMPISTVNYYRVYATTDPD